MKRFARWTAVVGFTLWTVWAIDMSNGGSMDRLGKVKGTDFLHFYVSGAIARDGRWDDLFDAQDHYARSTATVAGSERIFYLPVESPQTALLLAPLASLPYLAALACWLAISAALYAFSCFLTWRDCPPLRRHGRLVATSCIALPGFYSQILHGQTACLSFAAVAIFLFAMRRGRMFAAGLALGMLIYKPHWAAAAGLALIFTGEWSIVAGLVISSVAQLVLTAWAVGPSVMLAYLQALRTALTAAHLLEPRPSDSLRGVLELIMPAAPALAAYAVGCLAVSLAAAHVWRSRMPLELRLAGVLVGAVLVCPHVNSYDLVLLGVPAMLIAAWIAQAGEDPRASGLAAWMGAAAAAPLAGGLPGHAEAFLSVAAMGILLLSLARFSFVSSCGAPLSAVRAHG